MIALTVDICLILNLFWIGCALWRLGTIAQSFSIALEVTEKAGESTTAS